MTHPGGVYYRDAVGMLWFQSHGGHWFHYSADHRWVAALPPPLYFLSPPMLPAPGLPPAPATTTQSAHRAGALTWWSACSLAVAALAVVLIVVLLVPQNPRTAPSHLLSPISSSLAYQLEHVPSSVFDRVGVDSPNVAVTPPVVTHSQPPLKSGSSIEYFTMNAEYCPYCATERWAEVIALARFGRWSGLEYEASSSADIFPGTRTLTFRHASFTSPYVVVLSREVSGTTQTPGGGYNALQPLTANEQRLATTYDSPAFFPGSGAGGAVPFIDVDNKVLVAGSSFSPSELQGLSWGDIASGLTDRSNPLTQALVTTANYLSAAICYGDGGQPGSVCSSHGVRAATAALGLGPAEKTVSYDAAPPGPEQAGP